ncbi:putative protein-lysine deacylase ABHD14B [Penaeus vannamei]|nr:protein ABHD14A-like isoform X1 [Penaeus vannamei]XP_027235260.1 protein ABHD14A-like [Penaeus vannamei]
MAPSLNLSKVPMTPFRVMAVVAGFAAIFLVISAIRTTGPQQKLGAVFHHASDAFKRDTMSRTMADANYWKNVNLEAEDLPADINHTAAKVQVNSKRVNIMGTNTFYREAHPPDGVSNSGEVVVLLHGAAFKSETWLNLNTINLLAAMGHQVVAIDLPGYGETNRTKNVDKADFLQEFLTKLEIMKPIMVSPSMSGGFSIPYILKHPQALGGYVPVAPVDSQKIVPHASEIRIPTLIIYGSRDQSLGVESRKNLINIPTSQAVELPDAKHPAYLDRPNQFHTLLYNFIKQVHAHKV